MRSNISCDVAGEAFHFRFSTWSFIETLVLVFDGDLILFFPMYVNTILITIQNQAFEIRYFLLLVVFAVVVLQDSILSMVLLQYDTSYVFEFEYLNSTF